MAGPQEKPKLPRNPAQGDEKSLPDPGLLAQIPQINMDGNSIVMLTMDQFAAVMQVHPNTVKSWKSNGILRCGKDYIQSSRRYVRILVGPDLIKRLLEINQLPRKDQAKAEESNKRKSSGRKANRNTPRLNLE